jgi:Fur family ferric uptake transcriptional regulator
MEKPMNSISGLAEKLKQAGYKLTRPRQAVIDVLESHPEHMSHDQILRAGRKIFPQLSRATVYRTMDLLVELDLLRPMYLNDPTQRFVSGYGGHHHLVCSGCGTVFEFEHCTVDQLAQELSQKYRFQIQGHLLEFYGKCEVCQN